MRSSPHQGDEPAAGVMPSDPVDRRRTVTRGAATRGGAGAALLALLLLSLAGWRAPHPTSPGQRAADGAAADTGAVSVGVRPERVRVGQSVTYTVTVRGEAWPTQVLFSGHPALEVTEERERRATGVGPEGRPLHVLERDVVARVRVAGLIAPPPVMVELYGTWLEAPVPLVEAVEAPIDWGSPGARQARRPDHRRDHPARPERPEPVLPEGVPPTSYGRGGVWAPPLWQPFTGEGTPWLPYGLAPLSPSALAPGLPLPPYAWPGGLPPAPWAAAPWAPGGVPGAPPVDWASAAAWAGDASPAFGPLPPEERWSTYAEEDPYWDELVPEVFRYQRRGRAADGAFGVDLAVTPDVAFVGQQVTALVTARYPPEALAALAGGAVFPYPVAEGAWAVDLPYGAPFAQAVEGRAERAHNFARAFFPSAPGTLVVSVPAAAPAAGAAEGPSVPVEVRPLPPDAPPGWGGAVGRYRLLAWLEPERVPWGEPAVLTLEVSGAGYLPAVSSPDPGPVRGAGLRALGARTWLEVKDGVVGGVKRFKWLVAPGEEGPLRIGPVVFPFFDPWLGGYTQVASDELVLEVAPLTGR